MQERNLCSQAGTKIAVVEENQGKWLLIFTRPSTDIPYKRDNKFNRNTLEPNSLPHKVLNLHIFTPRNINSTYGNISSGTLLEAMLTSIMTRTANLRDLLENIFDCSSPSHAGQFPLIISLRRSWCYLSWRPKLSRSLCLHSYFISNSNISLQKRHNKLTPKSVMRTWRVNCWRGDRRHPKVHLQAPPPFPLPRLPLDWLRSPIFSPFPTMRSLVPG